MWGAPRIDDSYLDLDMRLQKERALVFFIFERALGDAIGRNIEKQWKRDAKKWLFSKYTGFRSATWYAELADLEHVLEACRRIVRIVDSRNDDSFRDVVSKSVSLVKKDWYGKLVGDIRAGAFRARR